jgi:hypothetical protein
VLMSLQTRAKFLGTQSTTSVTVSMTRHFHMTLYLVVRGFLFLNVFTMRSEIAVNSCYVLLINHKAVGLLFVRLTELLLVDSILLSYHSAVESPQYCSAEIQKET